MRRMVTASLTGIFLLAFCLSALATGYAGTATYTDSLQCTSFVPPGCTIDFPWDPPSQPLTTYGASGDYWVGSSQTFGPLSPVSVVLSFQFSAPLSDFEETINCSPPTGCRYEWGGDFSGGTIGMTADITPFPNGGTTQTITFAGVINAGSFDARYSTFPNCMPCAIQSANLDFSGQWSTGWTSTGGMSLYNELPLDEGSTHGTLGLNTQTPEPASLCLFGTGVIGLAGTLHRKRALRRCGRGKVDVKPA